jgi:hypothetical protein
MFNEMITLRRKWHSIKARCYNEKNENYKNYGNRGIIVCEEWLKDFWEFYEWSILNGYKKGLTIDRIDNNLGYSPSNCRYVDYKIQNNNTKRNVKILFKGEQKTLGEIASEYDIDYKLLFRRYYYQKMSIEKAISIPARRTYNGVSQKRGAEKPIVSSKNNRKTKYNSLIEAEYVTGVSRKNISKVLRGTNKTAGGYCWEYEVKEYET